MKPAQLPITGTGRWRFRMRHDWLRVPDHIRFGNTHALAYDRAGLLHVGHTVHAQSGSRDAVAVFAPDGAFVRSWGARFADGLHGLEHVVEEGEEFFYLTHLKLGLFKVDARGEVVWQLEKPEYYRKFSGLRWEPSNVAVAPDGTLFLADGYGSFFIVRLDRAGRELDLIGGPGRQPHCCAHPHGLAVDARGAVPLLVVCDNVDTGLHYLTFDGRHVDKREASMRHPRHARQVGDHLIVPDLGGCVTVLDRDNRLVCHLGDARRPLEQLFPIRNNPTFEPGWFVHPHDAIMAPDGAMIVSEWVEVGRVTRLEPDPA
jgi:hypothetical protein